MTALFLGSRNNKAQVYLNCRMSMRWEIKQTKVRFVSCETTVVFFSFAVITIVIELLTKNSCPVICFKLREQGNNPVELRNETLTLFKVRRVCFGGQHVTDDKLFSSCFVSCFAIWLIFHIKFTMFLLLFFSPALEGRLWVGQRLHRSAVGAGPRWAHDGVARAETLVAHHVSSVVVQQEPAPHHQQESPGTSVDAQQRQECQIHQVDQEQQIQQVGAFAALRTPPSDARRDWRTAQGPRGAGRAVLARGTLAHTVPVQCARITSLPGFISVVLPA